MPEPKMKMKCEAVILRYMHSAVTGEFLNFGVVLKCDDKRFIDSRMTKSFRRLTEAFDGVSTRRLRALFRSVDGPVLSPRLLTLDSPQNLEKMLQGILHTSNSSVQLSPTISGWTMDPAKTLEQLFRLYVKEPAPSSRYRGDEAVWRTVAAKLGDLESRMQSKSVVRPHYELVFKHSWKNGKWNSVQPLSFDASEPESLREKATKWVGKLHTAKPWEEKVHVLLLVGDPCSQHNGLATAYDDARKILRGELPHDSVELVSESDSDTLVDRIRRDLCG